jgi:hypothetical protein
MAELIAQSGARRLAMHNIHDIQYPLMRRLQRRVPGLIFAGAPASDATPPDGILIFGLGKAQPLYAQFAGREDWRLVGDGFGDGMYLPEPRVRALGWWNRLPAFAGWDQAAGLPLADWFLPATGQFVAREMPTGEAELRYLAHGRPMRLTLALRRTTEKRPPLQLAIDARGDTPVVRDCGAEASVEFSLEVPSSEGLHWLHLRANAAAQGTFVLTRLQINDAP